jgi:hypothetical protein
MLKMLANPRMLLLLPMMFFTGLNNTFYAAWFTRQILSCHTGLVLLALGAGEMIGAYVAGGVLHPRVRVPGSRAHQEKSLTRSKTGRRSCSSRRRPCRLLPSISQYQRMQVETT